MNFAPCKVDIGTEWNLKYILLQFLTGKDDVDIGTEWNLKDFVSELVT